MKVIDPTAISTSATHARSSTAWAWDWAGVLQSAAPNVLRFSWDRATGVFQGALVEPAATNLVLNSATLTNQTIAVSSGQRYTLSFYGSGSVNLSGALGATLTGASATGRTTYTFYAGSSALTLTLASGSLTYAQLELGAVATSPIVTTSSAITRAADVITGAGVFYSSFTDATAPWSSGTTYALAAVVKLDGRKYESLQASNTNHAPAAEPTWWLDTGPDNTFAMLDRQVTSQSVGTLSGDNYVCVKLATPADAVAALNLTQVTLVHLVLGDGWSAFYSAYKTGSFSSVTLTTPTYGDIATVVAKGPAYAPYVPRVGEVVLGRLKNLGDTEYGLSTPLVDFSKKETDALGVTSFVERAYSKRLSCSVRVTKANYNTCLDLVYSLRARPSVWIATDDAAYSSGAVVYGFVKDFTPVIAYPTASLFSLEIEGLI